LRAIASFNQHFVGAAVDGSIAISPDAQTWTTRATGNTQLLTAVAANESMCVAVGFGGTVLRSSAVESAPVIVTAPASITEAAGNHVLLSVVATGSAPLTYEWQHEGSTIAGATRDTLALRAVSAADVGRYRVIVRNPLGGVASNPATVAVAHAFAAPGDPVDPSFTPWRPPLGSPAPTALLPLPDGKILAAFGVYVARLLPDGALDPTFGARAQPTENITALALLPARAQSPASRSSPTEKSCSRTIPRGSCGSWNTVRATMRFAVNSAPCRKTSAIRGSGSWRSRPTEASSPRWRRR
jgi:hypothetical protein